MGENGYLLGEILVKHPVILWTSCKQFLLPIFEIFRMKKQLDQSLVATGSQSSSVVAFFAVLNWLLNHCCCVRLPSEFRSKPILVIEIGYIISWYKNM